jgi:D-ribose pyranose/furanose isomerase RbsD
MLQDEDNYIETKIDVEVLKAQVLTLTSLCNKIDLVIEKLVDQQSQQTSVIYNEMEKRRLETETDIKEIHDRIDTVLDKLQNSELRITSEIKALHNHILLKNQQEKSTTDETKQWKWMAIGGVIVISWILSHVDIPSVIKFLK